MRTLHLTLPNSTDNFILMEMCERLKAGQTVTMLFGGVSMLPLINGRGDKIRLRPLAADEKCVKGEVYMFLYQNHFVIHRLMNVKGSDHDFRGDNCFNHEHVTRENVLAKLIAIEQVDGNVVDCESDDWHRKSRKVVLRRSAKNNFMIMKSPTFRSRLAVLYFVLLAALMWAPINGLGIALDNYILGLRADHLLHASVYLFCPLFLADWFDKRWWRVLFTALSVGVVTEFGQMLLPFRGFDVNDLMANCVGNILGWAAILPLMKRHRRIMKNKNLNNK